MKKYMLIVCAGFMLAAIPQTKLNAQIPFISIVTSAVKKVIVALDLKVQQLQNKTIMLQNAEAELENKMSLGDLNDISGWLTKEKNLYSGYYQEL